ncbi:MAG: BrnA antitoxin family protein [Fidelibacterota bacterium]
MKRDSNKTQWQRLANLRDDQIDYGDIPETDEAFWKDADVVFPGKKVHLSIRLDEDIVNWFKQFGHGYQTRINAVLRSYVRTVTRRRESRSVH